MTSTPKPICITFHGYIETTKDSLLLFEACKRGILPRVTRRLLDNERHLIQSGSIFCFDEKESGMKRWTDGLTWSPSRIMGHFLIYRELQNKKQICKEKHLYHPEPNIGYIVASDLLKRQKEKAVVGSLTSVRFKQHGLIKKSMSILVDGVQQHIISYYSKEDVLSNKLVTPSSMRAFASLEVSPGLHLRQNFRTPAMTADDSSIPKKTKRKCLDEDQQVSIKSLKSDTKSTFIRTTNNNSIHHSVPLSSVNNQIQIENQPTVPESSLKTNEYDHYALLNNNNVFGLNEMMRNHHISATFNQGLIASGGYYPSFCTDDQNPHQHLFSSGSFHAVNHASIISHRTADLVATNSFMEDINLLLGTGWNDFELQ
ncbi:hypothetical protein CU098_005151, partial [Rhizopus stolonifer]